MQYLHTEYHSHILHVSNYFIVAAAKAMSTPAATERFVHKTPVSTGGAVSSLAAMRAAASAGKTNSGKSRPSTAVKQPSTPSNGSTTAATSVAAPAQSELDESRGYFPELVFVVIDEVGGSDCSTCAVSQLCVLLTVFIRRVILQIDALGKSDSNNETQVRNIVLTSHRSCVNISILIRSSSRVAFVGGWTRLTGRRVPQAGQSVQVQLFGAACWPPATGPRTSTCRFAGAGDWSMR